MLKLLLPLLLPLSIHAEATAAEGTLSSYRGSVAPMREDRTLGNVEKTFDLVLLATSGQGQAGALYWTVEERGRGAWPWIERFGKLASSAIEGESAPAGPALLYELGETSSPIAVPIPLFDRQQALAEGETWSVGGLRYAVQSVTKFEDRPAWQVQAANNYGPKRVLWVDQKSCAVLGLNERVFMGMGEEYELRLRLVGEEKLTAGRLTALERGFESLGQLRERLKLPGRQQVLHLNEPQRALLNENMPRLEGEYADELLAKIMRSARRDLELQGDRASAVAKLQAKYEGSTPAEFQIRGLSGELLSATDLKGQVTVLHFWDYRDAPLQEPYGQVGYLDFLAQRRKSDEVKVYGVAVDGRLGEEPARVEAVRGIRRLKAFMNLSYPILLDEGRLIKQFGDPRLVGAELPLFVVIGRSGKIAHYRVGHYEVDRNEGLKELNAAVSKALRD